MHDEKLILYYYDDGLSKHERQEVETALRDDGALAARSPTTCARGWKRLHARPRQALRSPDPPSRRSRARMPWGWNRERDDAEQID